MYDILGKLNSLTPQEKEQEVKKPIYESVEARGSIVAGVKDIEKKLREQYESMEEERETLKTKTGTIYKGGTYGTEYDPSDEEKKKKPKHVPKTGQKGRPKKDKPAEYSKSNDPFGRVPDKAPKGKKGTVIKGKATIDTNEAAKNPYAIGMAQAKKEIGLGKAKVKGLPKSTIKRAHHIGDTIKANESRQQQLTNMLLEGVNFTEMIKKKDLTLQEMLAELQADIQTFKETGHCSELLRDCMEVHSFNKQQLNDAVKGPSFAPQHPGTPDTKPTFMDKAKDFGGHVLNKLGHGSDEELKADLRKKIGMTEADHLDELARLAGLSIQEANDGNLANNAKPYDKVTRGDVIAGRLGKDEQGGKKEVDEDEWDRYGSHSSALALKLDRVKRARDMMKDEEGEEGEHRAPNLPEGDMEEGNEFSGELAKAKAQHQDSFEVDGKTYPVKEGTCKTCHDDPCSCDATNESDVMEDIRRLAGLQECGEMSPIGSMAQDMQKQQGRMSVNTSQSTDGTKNINISADGEAADQLMQILKMAGMAGGQQEQHAEVVIAAQPMEARDYGDTEVEDAPEYINSPRERVKGMHSAETTGFADQTDDLNKQKDQDPETANKAANPKTKEMPKLESVDPLESLGAKLMAEYNSIKIAK